MLLEVFLRSITSLPLSALHAGPNMNREGSQEKRDEGLLHCARTSTWPAFEATLWKMRCSKAVHVRVTHNKTAGH